MNLGQRILFKRRKSDWLINQLEAALIYANEMSDKFEGETDLKESYNKFKKSIIMSRNSGN